MDFPALDHQGSPTFLSFFFFFFLNKIYLFGLCWLFLAVHGPSPVVSSGCGKVLFVAVQSARVPRCGGFPCRRAWAVSLQASVAAAGRF